MNTISKILSHELTGHQLTAGYILIGSIAIPTAFCMTIGPMIVKFFV